MMTDEQTATPIDARLAQRQAIKSRIAAAGIVDEQDPAHAPGTTDEPTDEVDDQLAIEPESSDEDLELPEPPSSSDEQTVLTMEDADKVMVQTDDGPKPLSEIMQGNMRNAHYTQQRQVQAETKRKLDTLLDDVVLQTAANKTFLDEQLDQYKHVNWEMLAAQQPDVYRKEKPGYDALMKYRSQIMERFQQIKQHFKQQDKEQLERDWKSVDTDLKFTIPNWNQDRKKELSDLAMKRYGFSEADLARLADKRFWDLLHDAAVVSKVKAPAKGKPKPAARKGVSAESDKMSSLKRQAQKGDQRARAELQHMGIKAKLQRMGIK